MKKQLFGELAESIRHAGKVHSGEAAPSRQTGKVHRGEAAPSRRFVFKPSDVRAIRAKLHKSQSEFAQMIGVSLNTLQNWEQGRRQPEGPARALLVVASKNPEAVAKALSSATRRGA